MDDEMVGRWIETAANHFGLESEPTHTTYAEIDQFIRGVSPAIFQLSVPTSEDNLRFFVLLKGGRRQLSILKPDLSITYVPHQMLRDTLCEIYESPHHHWLEQLLTTINVPQHRWHQARRAILSEQIGTTPIRNCWLLRPLPNEDLWKQAKRIRIDRTIGTLLGAYGVQQILTILGWGIIGQSALTGNFDKGWLWLWVIVLLTGIPFQMWIIATQNRLAIDVGGLFKQRLLYGTLKLEPDALRHQGVGQFLGRVMESEAVEQLALVGGLAAILSIIQVGTATMILWSGAGGGYNAAILVLWLVVTLGISLYYVQKSHTWTDVYREMTNDLVERMVGHRTRLAQENREYWHTYEDVELEHYFKLSVNLDNIQVWLNGLIPRGWVLLSLAGLAYGLINNLSTPEAFAISLGGILLALQALTSIITGVQSVAGARVAWKQIVPIFQAASDVKKDIPTSLVPKRLGHLKTEQPVITANEIDFQYQEEGRLILQGCSLQIRPGDRLLLQGPSGGGKSTIAALLSGLYEAQSGLFLLWGFDRDTLGAREWRRRVVVVPQFHENHVFTGTLAFNLLMGRCWPPKASDLAEAESICREIGLGTLLDHMPSGLQQIVGESGWQLSHGERSRIYIARSILQKADLVILDESFGALDPESMQLAMRCVLNRVPTLFVIAHP